MRLHNQVTQLDMADRPSVKPDPLVGWKTRLYEEQQTLQFVEEELRQSLEDVKSLETKILKEKEFIRQEKLKLVKRLEETELIGKKLEEQCERQSETKSRVEAIYQQALDEYDRLHDVVKKVKAKEKECESRPDLEKTLQAESYAWADEEHRLRTHIQQLQNQVREAKNKQQDETAQAEAKLRDAEARLHSDRMSREFPLNAHKHVGAPSSRQGSRAAFSRGPSTSLGRGVFTDESLVLDNNNANVRAAHPAPILVNKATSRKRDHLGDLTNLS
jgi:myosin heavy subunit